MPPSRNNNNNNNRNNNNHSSSSSSSTRSNNTARRNRNNANTNNNNNNNRHDPLDDLVNLSRNINSNNHYTEQPIRTNYTANSGDYMADDAMTYERLLALDDAIPNRRMQMAQNKN